MTPLDGCFDVASWNRSIIIKIEGYATLNNSIFFRDFVEEMLKQGFRDFIIDLSACKGMDSTFMGVIASVANLGVEEKEAAPDTKAQTKVTLVNTRPYHQKLLDSLGISCLFCITKQPVQLPTVTMTRLTETKYDPTTRLQVIQQAHKYLASLNQGNTKKFGDFLKLLQQELNSE